MPCERQQNLGTLRLTQIKRYALLAAVNAVIVARVSRIRDSRRVATRIVATARYLDFDYFGTEVGKIHRAERAGEHAAEVENTYSVQRLLGDHRNSLEAVITEGTYRGPRRILA